jgi:hypothetical protein
MSGDLLRYRDRDPCSDADIGGSVTVGHGGWQQFKSVFTGGCDAIYAITV